MVRVVFATTALGMGVNIVGLNTIIHYGAPLSIDDYVQESGRAGRTGAPATSTIYWKPSDVPLLKGITDAKNRDINAVHKYVENNVECRRRQLLSYFDEDLCKSILCQDRILCCDVCASEVVKKSDYIND